MESLARRLAVIALVAAALAAAGARAQTCAGTCTTNYVVQMAGLMCPPAGQELPSSVCARLRTVEAGAQAIAPAPSPATSTLACAPGESTLCARLAALETALAAVQALRLYDLVPSGTIVLSSTGTCPPGFTATTQYDERFLAFGPTPGTTVPVGPLTPLSGRSFALPGISNAVSWGTPQVTTGTPSVGTTTTRTTASVASTQSPMAQRDATPLVYMLACIKP